MPRTKDPENAIATARRDARIVELRRENTHYADIAAEVGLSPARCHQIFTKWMRDIPAGAAATHRDEELDLLARGIRDLLALAQDGQVSARTRAECWKEIRQHSESRRKLLGLDAPLKREIEIVDLSSEESRMNREMAELEAEIRAHDALHQGDQA